MSLSPAEQKRLNESPAESGKVVYVGNNNVGPSKGPHRKYSGEYTFSTKQITARSPTDPQVGQLPNLSGRKNVTVECQI
jgi:hypothetical protein